MKKKMLVYRFGEVLIEEKNEWIFFLLLIKSVNSVLIIHLTIKNKFNAWLIK